MDEKFVTVKHLAEKTDLPESWWYSRVEAGQVPHFRLGKYVRFRLSEILNWLEAQKRGVRNDG